MALTRELIRDGWIQQLVATSGEPVHILSEEELASSRAQAMAAHPAGRAARALCLRVPDLESGISIFATASWPGSTATTAASACGRISAAAPVNGLG